MSSRLSRCLPRNGSTAIPCRIAKRYGSRTAHQATPGTRPKRCVVHRGRTGPLAGCSVGLGWLDAVAAIIVGLLVRPGGLGPCCGVGPEAFGGINRTARRRPTADARCRCGARGGSYHDLRTRQSPAGSMVDLHIVSRPQDYLLEAHEIVTRSAGRLRHQFPAFDRRDLSYRPRGHAGVRRPSRLPGLPLAPGSRGSAGCALV